MKKFCFLILSFLPLLTFANPVVSNIRASQRENTKLVDILYDVTYSSGDTLQKLYGSSVFIADTLTVPMDTNTNGLPNIWEMRYFGGTTAANASALAANGLNTIYETYVAGLNPTNPASQFVVQLIENAGRIQWPSVQNRNYTVQYSPSLTEPFTNVTTGAGTGGDMSYSSSPDSEPQGFYRVNIELP